MFDCYVFIFGNIFRYIQEIQLFCNPTKRMIIFCIPPQTQTNRTVHLTCKVSEPEREAIDLSVRIVYLFAEQQRDLVEFKIHI